MTILLLKFYIIHIAFNFGSTLCQLGENIEIKSLTAEPSYKSVFLTWFVGNYKNATIRKNNDFYVHYCELQTWGSHRCKTKTIKDNTDYDNNKRKQYSTVVDNLKMATKYLFHVESVRLDQQKTMPRVDFGGNELNSDLLGEKVIVPTKGFSAQATKCLPHVSEIEIQTGPFFGGIIMSENNENCQIQGNPLSDQHFYVIRIDHEKCGSQVDHAQVTTSITVQENVGIFTHSTRRFAVMCSYQPDTLTVRTSFSIPSRSILQSPKNTTDRESRKRTFRIVGKEALLLATETSQSPPLSSLNETEVNNFINDRIDNTPDTLGFNGDVSVIVQRNENIQQLNATFDRLTYESKLQKSEKSATSSVFIVLGFTMLSIIIFTAFVFLVGRKLRKWPLVKF